MKNSVKQRCRKYIGKTFVKALAEHAQDCITESWHEARQEFIREIHFKLQLGSRLELVAIDGTTGDDTQTIPFSELITEVIENTLIDGVDSVEYLNDMANALETSAKRIRKNANKIQDENRNQTIS